MVRKAAGEYSKTKEEQLGQAVKAAFDWFSTCYGAITLLLIATTLFYRFHMLALTLIARNPDDCGISTI